MTATATTTTKSTTRPARGILLSWLFAAVVGIVVATIITRVGLALGASTTTATGQPVTAFMPVAYIPVIVVITLIGAVFWSLITRRAKNPRRLLTIFAIVLLVIAVLPPLVFGLGLTGLITMLLEHLAILAIGVLVYSRVISK
jgi:nitrogen fixation/metabolism regulation signal transduction histidine kinase